MNALPRHADQVRRSTTFVHEVMRQRGLSCMRNELEAALAELTADQLASVDSSAARVARGGERNDDLRLLAALRTISARTARRALAAAGALYRADVLLALAFGDKSAPAFTRELASLRREDLPQAERDKAGAALLAMCGPLDHSDLLPTAVRAESPAQPPLSQQDIVASVPSAQSAARNLRLQVKVYGKSAALTVESAPVRQRDAPDETQPPRALTVMLEGAQARGDGTFDWNNKIVFACSQRELPPLLAVLLGWQDSAEFKFHGGKAGKELAFQAQEQGLFVRLRDASAVVAVPVTSADRYALAMLVLNVMAINDPSGDRQAVLAVCRAVMCPRPPA